MGGFFGGGGASVDLASPSAIGSTTPNTGAFTTLNTGNGAAATPSLKFSGSGGANAGLFYLSPAVLVCHYNNAQIGFDDGANVRVQNAGSFAFSSTTNPLGTLDTILKRDASNTLALRNSTNAQTFRIYNTFTDASNYERGFMRWATNVLEIGAEAAGTGTKRTTRITAQDKTGGYAPIIELGFYPNNLLATRLSFTNNSGAAVQWGIDGSFIGNFSTDGFMVGSAQIGWNSGVPQNSADLVLTRDAADILAQRRTTNSQTFRLYRTFTNSTNYERLSFIATRTTRFAIAAENAGTGAARSLEISFYTSASDPASTDITDGCFSVWKNSGTGTIKLWANDGGTMKSVALA